jgi:hypothetical protein
MASFFLGVTEHFAHGPLGEMFPAINTKGADPNLRILENRPEELFGRLHAVLGAFAHRFSL